MNPENLNEDEEYLKKFVDENGFLTFTRTSCKNRQNVNETMDYLLANIIDRLEEYYKNANIPIDDKRTSIVVQNSSESTESLLNSKKSTCC